MVMSWNIIPAILPLTIPKRSYLKKENIHRTSLLEEGNQEFHSKKKIQKFRVFRIYALEKYEKSPCLIKLNTRVCEPEILKKKKESTMRKLFVLATSFLCIYYCSTTKESKTRDIIEKMIWKNRHSHRRREAIQWWNIERE